MNTVASLLGRSPLVLGAALLVSSCIAPPSQSDIAAATQGMVRRSEFEIVDCLLPGELRQLGNMSVLTQRRPLQTTVSECWTRGGEYVAYDRADLNSALRVWMEAAESGDPEAQTKVGEIYERGLGVEPNYEAALMWYEKAAAQGYTRALFNLGTLYEHGQGVAKDGLKALNLYRQASGIPADSLIYTSAAQREQAHLRQELEASISARDTQIGLLQTQLHRFEQQLASHPPPKAAQGSERKQIDALKKWIEQLRRERRTSDDKLAALPLTHPPQHPSKVDSPASTAAIRKSDGLNFGRYYAVVIGNQDYELIEDLQTARYDAERIARLLRSKYGFSVTLLDNANDTDMLRVLNNLNSVLKPEDNLLIYYAGHGERVTTERGEAGYWLPVNADAPPKDTFWVPNEQITMHLARLPAKRVLVVADSCYAGLLSNDPSYLFLDESRKYSKEYLAYKLPKRSRLLLASGGNKPVRDEGGGANSVFARAFADELETNDEILSTPELFGLIRRRVESAATRNKFVQSPQFKSIKAAGHEVGDFFFVPLNRSSIQVATREE